MISLRIAVLLSTLLATQAWAQAQPQPVKTTEQQARSYILSAFMTGAAPNVLSDDVKIAPTFRERLALAPESDSRAIYYALVRMTAGKSLTVRPAKIDELERTETQVEPGKPMFALDVSESTFVMQYDLDRDTVTNVADATRPVAVTSPITAPEPPQPLVAAAEPAKPAPEPEPEPVQAAPATPAAPAAPAATTAPEPLPGARVQVVEPREPKFNKPVAPPAMSAPAALPVREEPRLPPLKPNGACVIKPVMSDQDLVNCGARVR